MPHPADFSDKVSVLHHHAQYGSILARNSFRLLYPQTGPRGFRERFEIPESFAGAKDLVSKVS